MLFFYFIMEMININNIGQILKNTRETSGLDLEEENDNLAEDNRKLQAEYRKLREEIDASDSVGSSRNTDLLRRISNLEKIVYGRE